MNQPIQSACGGPSQEVVARKPVLLFSREELAGAVKRLAQELDPDAASGHRCPVVVGILKGAFVFLADLVRQMETPLHSIEFFRLSSYGPGTVSSGRARVVMGPDCIGAVEGRDVILVEDIVDTGITTPMPHRGTCGACGLPPSRFAPSWTSPPGGG